MAQRQINPKLADAIIAQAAQDEENNDEQAWEGQSDYVPPWLELDRIKSEFAVNAEEIVFQVFRQGPGGIKDLSFIKAVAQDVFNYEILQSPPFNGGKFRVYIRKEGAGIRRNFLIEVEPGPDAIKPGQAAPATHNDSNVALIAAMSAGFQQMGQMIAKNQAPTGMGMRDTLELIATLKPLLTPAQIHTPDVDPITLLTRVMALQKELTPLPVNSDGDISGTAVLLEAMKTFGPALANGVKQSQAAQSQQPDPTIQQNPIALPAPAFKAADPNLPAQEDSPAMTDLEMKIAAYKAPLILAAATDADPYFYAGMLMNAFDDEEIATYIEAPDWFAQVCQIMPEAAPYPAWFAKMREEVIELLKPEPESDSVPS